MTFLKWTTPILLAAGLAFAGYPSLTGADAATAKPVQAEADANRLARDAETTSDDLRVINRCIDNGGGKSECLCVTQVMKYEMSLADYQRAARLYAVPASTITRGRQADFSRGDRAALPDVTRDVRSMVSAPNFEYRCEAARRYFKSSR